MIPSFFLRSRICAALSALILPAACITLQGKQNQEVPATDSIQLKADTGLLSASVNCDIVSRFIWRGANFGDAVSIQPYTSLGIGDLSLYMWGSFALASQSPATPDFLAFWLQYPVETSFGTFTTTLSDWVFRNVAGDTANAQSRFFFNTKGEGHGNHIIEAALLYTGPDAFPVEFLFAKNVYNDPGYSGYMQVSYPFEVNDISLKASLGGVTGKSSMWYFTEESGFHLYNVQLSATKNIDFTAQYSVPVTVSYVLNPYTETSWMVFSVTL